MKARLQREKNAFYPSGEIPIELSEGSRDSTDSKEFADPQCEPSANLVDPMDLEGPASSRARPTVNKGKGLASGVHLFRGICKKPRKKRSTIQDMCDSLKSMSDVIVESRSVSTHNTPFRTAAANEIHICLILTSPDLVDKISNTRNMAPKTTRDIVNFLAFSSEIMRAALALLNFRFATRSFSNAAAIKACACFNSSLATPTACSNRLNLAITIGATAVPRGQQMLAPNHLKKLHAQSSSCTIQYNIEIGIQLIGSLTHNTNILPILGYGTY
nr:hypothetical protein CFP56_62953 [Quercus suber]